MFHNIGNFASTSQTFILAERRHEKRATVTAPASNIIHACRGGLKKFDIPLPEKPSDSCHEGNTEWIDKSKWRVGRDRVRRHRTTRCRFPSFSLYYPVLHFCIWNSTWDRFARCSSTSSRSISVLLILYNSNVEVYGRLIGSFQQAPFDWRDEHFTIIGTNCIQFLMTSHLVSCWWFNKMFCSAFFSFCFWY